MLQVDWDENGEIHIAEEVPSAYHGGKFSYHTAVQQSKEESGRCVTLSDVNDHKAEPAHAALSPTIEKQVGKGFDKFCNLSDSPTSQFKNTKRAFLNNRSAEKYNIRIEWNYTEANQFIYQASPSSLVNKQVD